LRLSRPSCNQVVSDCFWNIKLTYLLTYLLTMRRVMWTCPETNTGEVRWSEMRWDEWCERALRTLTCAGPSSRRVPAPGIRSSDENTCEASVHRGCAGDHTGTTILDYSNQYRYDNPRLQQSINQSINLLLSTSVWWIVDFPKTLHLLSIYVLAVTLSTTDSRQVTF